jgi:hypothetical protein
MSNSSAVSEMMGTLIMVGIVAGAVGIIAVAILSQPIPSTVPAINIVAVVDGNNLTILNQGGDTLPPGTYRILVNEQDRTADFLPSPANAPFAIGRTLALTPVTGVRSVTLIYQGGDNPEGIVLVQKNFS